MLEPVKKKRLYEEIMSQIRTLILDGKFHAGDKLPSERELAIKLNVARSSVREALRALELLGYLESRQGEGTFIKNRSSNEMIESMAYFILKEKDTLDDMFEVREIMECETVYLAALRATEEDIDRLEQIIQRACGSIKAGMMPLVEDIEFHYALAEASKNEVLLSVMNTISQFVRNGKENSLSLPGRPQMSINDHIEILTAIKEHDALRAREAMRNHLKAAKKGIIGD
jgi:GntR family transcriptional repressor for pyruvate dehydrogenase complex